VASTNKFKSIKLRKHPVWDYGQLEQAIRGAIRMACYRHHISITFPMENHQMSVQSNSKVGKAAKNPSVQALCCISCLWIFAYPAYLIACEKFNHCLRADFQMAISGQQWFMQNYWVIIANARGAVHSSNLSLGINAVANVAHILRR
jgi:hypothetical protein